jgi:hypothetical protein
MGRGHTLDSQVASWRSCIRALEAHSPGSLQFEEYEDWLTVRDGLERSLSLLSAQGRTAPQAAVGALDDSFIATTEGVSTSILPPSPWKPQHWWWYRVPSRVGDQFAARLRHLAPAAARQALD